MINIFSLPYRFWAKKEEAEGRLLWLSLGQHLEDTKNVAVFLWSHWLSDGQKLQIIDSLDQTNEEIAGQLVRFIALTHDIAKATTAFQKKVGHRNITDLDALLLERLEEDGFKGISQKALSYPGESPHALAGQYLLENMGVREDIASIIGSHHGKPVNDFQLLDNQPAYSSNYYQEEDPANEVHQLWESAQKWIFQRALSLSSFASIDELPRIALSGQVLLWGLVTMADWIASNTEYFPLVDVFDDRPIDQKKRMVEALAKLHLTELPSVDNIPDIDSLYDARFEFSPRQFQKIFSETIEQTVDPGIFVLEAPMGLGKTEAALVGAEQLAYQMKRSGLFFALPTQATSNGIFPRLLDWLERFSKSNQRVGSIQLVHGKAALNDDYTGLAKHIDIDGEENGTVIANQWFSGRRKAILDDFVVGTIDQVLMMALKQKHLALRHLALSKKVVIIDEVHAADKYMTTYLTVALRWLGAYRVPVILLSATLPAVTRENLVREYMKGRGLKDREIQLPEGGLALDAYPLVTYSDGPCIRQEVNFLEEKSKTVEIIRLNEDYLFDLLEDAVAEEGIVGIIVNTVKRSQRLAKELTARLGEEMVDLLHSNFIATDRKEKEQRLMDQVGKDKKRPKRKIFIGTQVMEQSLDIDFDLLVTDLAPIDLLIQRIGRLFRHEIDRPKNHQRPKCYVLGTDDLWAFEKGTLHIYGGYLLARTQYFLPDQIHIPSDLSPLVQKVYGKEPLELSAGLEEVYLKMIEAEEQKMNDKENRAKSFRISNPPLRVTRMKPNSLVGWLTNSVVNSTEEQGYAQVRDSEETVEVIALQKQGQGYGTVGGNEDLSGQVNDFSVGKKLASNTLRLPQSIFIRQRDNGKGTEYNIDSVIRELEGYSQCHLKEWEESGWLKGMLGIIFDEEGNFKLGQHILHYDRKYGLEVIGGGNESV